ncbi:peptide deformylase [Chitinophaga rhizophila]|uniref:Peptide deformylase n=1 Tax=Chitinophaga rhizophila TaxID=2866212 RepID=A0ABS7GGK4_9BACT|nr:peptide deformylase [Chitinophaga rhizophila]MBW8686255.1 peptide deformylase [Chitinophaga rhizophila]
MIRPIIAYGSPVLREATQQISRDTPGLAQLIADMWHTLDNAGGVGLAAPQVNVPVRLFLVDNRLEDAPLRQAFLNPLIIMRSAAVSTDEEGCLSIPGLTAMVTRPETITIRYEDASFQEHTRTFSGMDARIIQHEYDHIEGRLYTDLLSPLSRTLLKHKLRAVSKGRFRPGYPMQFPLRS